MILDSEWESRCNFMRVAFWWLVSTAVSSSDGDCFALWVPFRNHQASGYSRSSGYCGDANLVDDGLLALQRAGCPIPADLGKHG